MQEYFNYLFYYLEKEGILFDKSEFLFQIQSHPDYPTLLSVSDTLNFFNIDNCVARIDFSDLEFLPNQFVTLLNEEKIEPKLFIIQKKENKYLIVTGKKIIEISVLELEKKWTGIVFLVEKSENEVLKPSKNWLTWILPTLCLIIFLAVIFQIKSSLSSKLFFLLPFLGILFSLAALKDLFGTKSELINNFCNLTTSTSCTSIINSSKWKIFNFINFSDLAIVFFMSQFLGLLTLLIAGNTNIFFVMQLFLLIGSIPVVLLSLYFQKFIEKKWCPICLVIISIIILEICYLLFAMDFAMDFAFQPLILFGLVFFSTVFVWSLLKKMLIEQKELKENQLKSNRFVRNYQVFKNTLISKGKAELPLTPIVLGNKNSKNIITILTSPFCGHCEEVHEIMERILNKNKNELQIKLIIKENLEVYNDESKLFLRSLINIFFTENELNFRSKMNDWYDNKNISEWLTKHGSVDFDISKIDLIYSSQSIFCRNNGHNYTPAIFINGFEYPKIYERENLEFFINEIIEDNNF
jgi:uncharacterized membrane protein/glutaredoxin